MAQTFVDWHLRGRAVALDGLAFSINRPGGGHEDGICGASALESLAIAEAGERTPLRYASRVLSTLVLLARFCCPRRCRFKNASGVLRCWDARFWNGACGISGSDLTAPLGGL